jgi:hypothetical protein
LFFIFDVERDPQSLEIFISSSPISYIFIAYSINKLFNIIIIF